MYDPGYIYGCIIDLDDALHTTCTDSKITNSFTQQKVEVCIHVHTLTTLTIAFDVVFVFTSVWNYVLDTIPLLYAQ